MPNYLKMPKKSQVLALLELGWSYRRIEAETGVRRETISGYLRAVGIGVRVRSIADSHRNMSTLHRLSFAWPRSVSHEGPLAPGSGR